SVDPFCCDAALFVTPVHRDNLNGDRSEWQRPSNPIGIVMLLYGRGNRPSNTNAVTSHFHWMILALGILIRRVERFAILRAEIKRLSDLDAAVRGQRARLTTRTRIPGSSLSQVCKPQVGEIASEIESRLVIISLIRSTDHSRSPL